MRRPAPLLLLLLLLLAPDADAALLFSRNFDGGGGVSGTTSTPPTIRFSLYSGTGQTRETETILFFATTPTTGQVFSLDAGDGALFNTAATLLTNGVNDSNNLFFNTDQGGVGLGIGNDALTFYGDRSGARGIDLAGRTIARITLTLDALFLRTLPTQSGFFTDIALYSRLEIFGTGDPLPLLDDPNRPVPTETPFPPVPEPSTMMLGLVGAGIAGLGWMRRRRAA